MTKLTLVSVANARFINGQNSLIDCDATFSDGKVRPYTAQDATGDEMVQAVWDACKASSSLAAYVAPPVIPLTIPQQIAKLEASVTPRMYQEALINSTIVFPSGSLYAGLTSAQAIAAIRTQINTLRGQL